MVAGNLIILAKICFGYTSLKNKRVFSYNLCIKFFGPHILEISFTSTILFAPVMHPLRWLKSMFLKKFNDIPFFSLTWRTVPQHFGYKTDNLATFSTLEKKKLPKKIKSKISFPIIFSLINVCSTVRKNNYIHWTKSGT